MTDQERRIEWMRLDDLAGREAKGNSRVHNIPKLQEAITGLGFTAEPKIDEASGKLVWGHGRVATLRRLRDRGAPLPDGVRDLGDDWEIPVIRGWSSRNKHHAIAVREGDNRQGELGSYDDDARLEALSEIAADAPDLLRGIGYESADLDRLLESVNAPTELPSLADVDHDVSPFDRPRESRGDEQWGSGDTPDEGSTAGEDGPGPLDVEPAWRTLEPLRARYHDGTPGRADAIAAWLRPHATDVHVDRALAVTWRGRDGADYLPPGKWVTRYRGQLTVMSREEMAEEFVPANEPARRADRDAKPITAGKAKVPSAAELLRTGTGVLLGSVDPGGLRIRPVGDVLDPGSHA